MWTIAGGILLAILCLALLPVLGYVIVGGLGAIAVIALIFLAVENIALVLFFGAPFVAFYFYNKKKEEKRKEMQEVYEQLDTKLNLEKLYEQKGVLLLNSNKTKSGDYSRNIELKSFTINISYYFSTSTYFLSFKKNTDALKKLENYSNEFNWAPLHLSIDDLFLFDKELKEYVDNELEKELYICRTCVSTEIGFFDDAKKYERGNNKIFIFQHLITQDGVKTIKPIMCVEKIIADVAFVYGIPSVNVLIENQCVAEITAKKWNELRNKGMIKFASELSIWSQHEK